MTAQSLPVASPETISFDEFLTAYDGVHAEWVDGTVHVMTANSARHSDASRFLITLLHTYTARKRLGELYVPAFPMRLAAKPSGREPDLFFVRRENLDRFREAYFDGPADLVIEVVSATTRAVDRVEKFLEYQQAGVPEYWMIDPEHRTVEAYRLGVGGSYEAVALGDPPVLRSEAIPGMWIRAEWLWQNPMPDPIEVQKEWGLI